MDRKAFSALLTRYINGTATPEEKVLVEHWYELLYNNNIPALKQSALDNLEQEMWSHIAAQAHFSVNDTNTPFLNRSKRKKLVYYLTAAAIVSALVTGGWALFFPTRKTFSYEQIRQQYQLAESINNSGTPQKITLEDGSYILLQPNSKIAHANHFNTGNREVYLEGEAFFHVAKDPARPFYVYSQELVTKVLGTSFDVRAFPYDKTIKVLVHTGKVTVYQRKSNQAEQEQARSNATIVTPNQQVLFNRQLASITRSISVQPQVITTAINKNNDRFVFTDTPASEVFTAIQKAYGITIVFDEELMSHCPFTGAFTNETFFERINLVCKAIEATYEQADGQVIITGHDCEK